MAEEKKKRKKRGVLNIIIIIAAIVFVFSLYQVIKIAMDYHKGTSEYDELLQMQTQVEPAKSDDEDEEEEQMPQEESEESTEIMPDEFRPDFAALQEQNPDCIAWIRFPNIDINYPVLQGTDNNYYLKHTFSGEKVTAASIFMDFNNTPDFTDDNTVIYGHNMRNGSMFAKLNQFAEESYYKENPYFWIYTPKVIYRYDIFSCHVVNVETEEMYCQYAEAKEFTEYLEHLKEKSDYPIDMEVTSADRIVTLYTCNSAGSAYRYQVHAKQAAAFDAASGELISLPQKPKLWEISQTEQENQTEQESQEETQNE